MADGYNGWKNWETWNVNLWIDNEYPLYQQKVAFLRAPRKWGAELAAHDVRTFVESVFPDGTPDMQRDEKETVAEQMDKVDWAELTEHFVAEASEYGH